MDSIFDITTQMLDMTDFITKSMTQAAQSQAVADTAVIAALAPGGSYDIKMSTGAVIRGVEASVRQRFAVGDTVTIAQSYPGIWQITGVGGVSK